MPNPIRGLIGVLGAGAVAVARVATQVAGKYWDAYRALKAAFPNATKGILYHIASLGFAQAKRIGQISEQPTGNLVPINLAQPVLPPRAIAPYRYIADVSWIDPLTGERQYQRVGINSLVRLSGEDVRREGIMRALPPEESGEDFRYPVEDQPQAPPLPPSAFTVSLRAFLAKAEAVSP